MCRLNYTLQYVFLRDRAEKQRETIVYALRKEILRNNADMARGTLGGAIRQRRKLLRMTQRDLAELSQCAERLVHEVENGKTTLRLDRLLAMLRVLGLQLTLGEGREGIVVPDEG